MLPSLSSLRKLKGWELCPRGAEDRDHEMPFIVFTGQKHGAQCGLVCPCSAFPLSEEEAESMLCDLP